MTKENMYVALSMQDYKNHNYIDDKIQYIEDSFTDPIVVTAIDINYLIKKEGQLPPPEVRPVPS